MRDATRDDVKREEPEWRRLRAAALYASIICSLLMLIAVAYRVFYLGEDDPWWTVVAFMGGFYLAPVLDARRRTGLRLRHVVSPLAPLKATR
jgi:ABC-type Fe3+ transport system permease subunit